MGLVFFLGFGEGARPWELVVHFGEWTTSWGEKGGKWLETWESVRASGPL